MGKTLALLLGGAAVASASRDVLFQRHSAPNGYQLNGLAADTERVDLVVALKQSPEGLEKLDAKFWAVSDPRNQEYGNFMTHEEIQDLVAPSRDVRKNVAAFFSQFCDEVEDRGDNLRVTCSVRGAREAFQTSFFKFKKSDGSYSRKIVKAMGEWTLPSEIAQHIDFVDGISNFPIEHLRVNHGTAPAPAPAPVEGEEPVDRDLLQFGGAVNIPETMFQQYNIGDAKATPQQSHGVIEFQAGEAFSPSDLQNFAEQVGIKISPVSAAHTVGNLNSGVGTECTLDIQYIAGMGREAVNWWWDENTWLYDFATSFAQADTFPDVISISYGWAEDDQCQFGGQECQKLGVKSTGYVQRVNTEFQKIGLKGVTILAASGDSGANGRSDGECTEPELQPTFPGASPYLTAVGATQLNNAQTNLQNPPPACQQQTCASGGEEVAVSYDVANFASGGGFSRVASQPSYQTEAVNAYLSGGTQLPPKSYFNEKGRGYPDVAALGTAILIDSGGLSTVGGTSASCPEWAGILTLLNAERKAAGKPNIGFANPLLYQAYAADNSNFNDITKGDNKCTEDGCSASCKGFEAAAGWDPVSGLGSPNYGKLSSYVKNLEN